MSGARNGHVAPSLLAPRYKHLEVKHPVLTPAEHEWLLREFSEEWERAKAESLEEGVELSPIEEYLCWLNVLRGANVLKRYQMLAAAIERSKAR